MDALKSMSLRAAVSLLLLLVISISPAWSADKGRVAGQVKDSLNNIFLMGVLVSSDNGKIKTVTDRNGNYSLTLPAGQQEIIFSYLGYASVTKSVNIASGATEMLDIDFSQTSVQMEEMVVKGEAVGQARALNQQKTAPNLKNIVASDAIGRFPDQNAAEALDRIPGVSIERDQGEGRFVIIRGIDPHLNNASVDGVALASAEAGTRAVLLDTLPMSVMESLEVTKALTADMPADSIGGQINIVTPSAYDRSERTLHGSLGTNYSELTEDYAATGQLTYGDVFGDKKQFGLLVSFSYDEREFGSDNVEADPWELDDNDNYTTEELQYREYDLNRKRLGVTTNFEFKPNEFNSYYVRGLYGSFTDHEYRRRSIIGDMFMSSTSRKTGDIYGEDYPDDDGELYPTTELQLKDRKETQRNWSVIVGGENEIDSWTLDYKGAYTYAEQDTPYDTQFVYANETLNYNYSNASGYTPSVSVLDGDMNALDSYEVDGIENSWQKVEEDAWIFGVNVKKELDFFFQSYVKTGVHMSLRNKTNDLETREYESGPSTFDTLYGLTGDGRYEFSDFPLISKGLRGTFNTAKSQFEQEVNIEDSNAEDYETDEDVYAGYIMGEANFGKFSVIPGVRVEYTDLEAKGKTFDEETEAVGSQKKEKDYTNVLPSLHAKYNFTDDFVLYAAWTNTISRPEWEQTRYARLTDDDGNVEVGNPDLDPYKAMNWDATVSYYMPDSLGLASIGFFYKDIDDFIYPQTSYGDYELTTYHNGDSGKIYGVELVYQQQMSFLPIPFDGLSIEGNLTLSESDAEVMAQEAGESSRDIDFIRHSKRVGSVALSYEMEGLFVRLSGTYRSSYLDELGEEALEDRYIDDHFQVDLSSSYTFMDKYTLYANFINLTNAPLRAYWGESKRLSQYEEYGWSARAGFKFNF